MTSEAEERAWLAQRRDEVAAYLTREGVRHGPIATESTWFVAPYVSIWEIESLASAGNVGWWAVCGDHPTDYVSAEGVEGPRQVLKAIGERWLEASTYMLAGKAHPTIRIGTPATARELGDLLYSRAYIFIQWSEDESIWEGNDE